LEKNHPMQNATSCGTGAVSMAERHRNLRIGSLIVVLAAALAGCSHPTPPRQTDATSAAAPLPSLKDGVPVLATALVTSAVLPPPPPSGRYPVVIDPWIDVTTGSQVATTKLMQQELETLAPQHFPQLELLPFTPENLARKPVVLLGAIAPVAGAGAVEPVSGRPGAYRVYGMLADLGTGKIASAKDAWVRPEDIDPTPVRFYRDSPAWQPDESVAAYLQTLQAKPGDRIDPAYLQNLQAEALITNANTAYGQGEYQPARNLYNQAAGLPEGGHQLRVYNGLYLTNSALGDRRSATQAFSELVDYQVAHGRLSVKILFRPNATAFWSDPENPAPYRDWLNVIARRVVADQTCLHLTGHASPSGSAALNDRLSLARAERIRQDLVQIEPSLKDRITVQGVGSRDAIVGTGSDDATDLVDRRVDFQVEPCTRTAAAQ
jgi:outer membrane protein OmpA-like peptidoglycan-associated protein